MPLSMSVGVVDRSRTSDDPSTLTWCVVIGKPERSKLGSSPAKAPDAVAASPAVNALPLSEGSSIVLHDFDWPDVL